jgi:hypothetical protein
MADENDLSGGVLIVHHPPGHVYSTDDDYCALFPTLGPADCCLDQVNEYTLSDVAGHMFYIISQFYESKRFRGIELGIEYTELVPFDWGLCWAGLPGLTIEYPGTGSFPYASGTAVAATSTDLDWVGACVATHWIAAYAYTTSASQVTLVPSPQTNFIGWLAATASYAPDCIGALGLGVAGVYCCSEAPEPQACCMPDGSCVDVMDPAECDGMGGVLYPDPCAMTDCPQPQPQACCLQDGSCVDVFDQAECDALGGVLYPDPCAMTDCPQPPPEAACCFPDGSCMMMTADDCATAGGTWYEFEHCDTFQCPIELMACCMPDGSCVDVLSQGECDGMGGVLYPDPCAMTDCPQPPPEFACCFDFDEACYMMTEADCQTGGGTWYDGMVCSSAGGDFDCPMWRVCCEGEVCTITTEAGCAGVWHPEWDSCGPPNPCEEPVPADPSSWGSIKSIYR